MDYYFMEEDGSRFKVSYIFQPYFYILVKRELMHEVIQFLTKKYAGILAHIDIVTKEDLDLPNHLIGLKQKYIKLQFCNQNDLIKVRKDLLKIAMKNKEKQNDNLYYTEMLTSSLIKDGHVAQMQANTNQMDNILDIR